MAQSTKKLTNGEAVREFYASLKIIEEYYQEKGYRKKAYLYRTLKEKLGWKMSLESFKYHFKKHIIDGCFLLNPKIVTKQKITPKTERINLVDLEGKETRNINSEDDGEGPKIARANFPKAPRFNPHTVDVDPSRII